MNYVGCDLDPSCSPDYVVDYQKERINSQFDVVCAIQVLEHVGNPTAFISNIFDSVSDGGYFIGSVPFVHHIHTKYDYYRYTELGLRKMLSRFTEVKIIPYGSIAHALWKRMSRVCIVSIFFNATGPYAARIFGTDNKMPAGYVFIARKTNRGHKNKPL